MPITPEQAVDAARRHGLSLTDAAGLLGLADTPTEADAIAARFATGSSDATDELRAFTRDLFADRT